MIWPPINAYLFRIVLLSEYFLSGCFFTITIRSVLRKFEEELLLISLFWPK